jgi:alkanesulfonate monooxygenase SsuD/methylene tetrahydromethanopterin reductase-like flavin-dependent oxidoreductase (luciferase family)
VSVRIGVVAPTREELLFGSGDARSVVAFAEHAEAAGFDSVWVGESLLARPRFEPLTLLSAMAARTTTATLGTAVLLPALRHPLLLAHALATLDQLASGRLVVGVGAGASVPGTEAELAAVGVGMAARIGRLVEGTRLVRALWRGPLSRWDSTRWPLDAVDLGIRPHRHGGPPLWLGGDAPATLERAGRWFDGWMPFVPKPARYARGWAQVRQAAEAAGRDPDRLVPALYVNVTLDDDAAWARAEQAAHLGAYYGVDPELMTQLQASHAGSVESAADWASGFVAAGARHLVLRLTARRPADQLDAAAALAGALRSTATSPSRQEHPTGGRTG